MSRSANLSTSPRSTPLRASAVATASRSLRTRRISIIGSATVASAAVPAIEVSGLVVRYGATTAVDGLSFTAEAGEVLAVLGPNGAGKTTTVETLEGYRRPSAGAVRVVGLDPIADRAAVVPHIGVMLQRGGVYPGMGPLAALPLLPPYSDHPAAPDGLLDLVGLQDAARTPWRRLSGG